MSAPWWLLVFALVAIAAAFFYGGKRWIAGRDPEALRGFFDDKRWIPLAIIGALLVALIALAGVAIAAVLPELLN